MAQGDVEARVVATTSGLQAGMVQAAAVTEAQMKKIAQYVKAANDSTAQLERTARSTASTTASAYSSITASAEKVSHAHAGVSRELLVMAHELSQGNTSRFGGSLMVLAERTNALQFAMTGAGAAVLGTFAAFVGIGALLVEGALDSERFAKNLQLTGNYAAVTEQQIRLLADAQSKQTGQSSTAARGTVEAVAGSGLFTAEQLASASRALGDYQRMTGATAGDALAKFKTIQDGVAKWAEEENKSVHFITAAEYEHIKALEDSGQKQQAVVETLNAYAGAIETRGEPAVGLLARAWHAVAAGASAAATAIMNVGRPTDQMAASIAAVDQQMALVRQANTGNPAAAANVLQQLAAERQRLEQLQFRAGENLSAKSNDAAIQQAAIEADNYTSSILKGAHALSERTKELQKWDAAVAAKAATGHPMSSSDVNAGRAEIMKRYSSQPGDAQASEYANLMSTIKAFNSTTDEEISRVGKLTDGQKFSIQAHEDLAKAGKKLSEQQRETIASAIDEAVAHRTVADMIMEAQKATIAAISADTTNQQQQQSIVESVIAAGNDQANAILRNAQLIGKSTDEITKIQELQKFDDLVGKALLGADNDTVKRITDIAAALRGNLSDSIDAAKTKQDAFNASFVNGWAKAQQDYVKQAANSAAFGEKFFTDAINGMSDALATFATTGKLNWKSLLDSMINDLVRMQTQKGFAALFGGGADGTGSGIGSLLGAGESLLGLGGAASGAGSASFANLFSSNFGGAAFANGLDYVPYDGFPAVLHEGERVASRQDAAHDRAGRGGHTFNTTQNINVGQGVSRSEVAQAVSTANAQSEARMRRLLKNGSIPA